MPNFFGQDFSSSQPTDSDYARHTSLAQGSTVLRDLKTRIKAFFSVLFNPDTSEISDGVIRTGALMSLTPNPSGDFREVDVNKKGLVTGGREDIVESGPQPYRAIFWGDAVRSTGKELPTGNFQVIPLSYSGTLRSLSVRVYDFTVPPGVTKLKFWASDRSAILVEGVFPVSPGQTMTIFVGDGVVGSGPVKILHGNLWINTAGDYNTNPIANQGPYVFYYQVPFGPIASASPQPTLIISRLTASPNDYFFSSGYLDGETKAFAMLEWYA